MSEITRDDILEANKLLKEFQDTLKDKVNPKLTTLEEKMASASSDTREKLERIKSDMEKRDKELQEALVKIDGLKNSVKSKEESIAELEAIIAEKSISKDKEKEFVDRIKELENSFASDVNTKDKKGYVNSEEYKSLMDYVKQGPKLEMERVKYLRTDNGANGGYLVPVALNNQIMEEVEELDPIRGLARVFSSKTKALEIPIRTSLPVATYEGEAEQVGTSNSNYKLETLTAYAQSIQTPLTWDIIQFANYDMIQQASKDAAMAFAIGEGTGFLKGNGVKQPSGIVTNATIQAAAATSAASGKVSLVDVIQLPGNLKTGYINNARFFMNQKTLFALRSEQDENGNFLWRIGGEGMPNEIAGIPYVILPGMDNVAANSYSVGVGDFFYGYYILDAVQVAMVRDEVTEANKRIVKLTWFKWNTGQVGIPEAFKLLKTKA